MYCKNCGAELKEGQEVCLACGVKVGKGNQYCAKCGEKVKSLEQDVCLNCGAKLKTSVSISTGDSSWVPEGKDKIVAILLAFFLGGLGIHNFYLGETKKGIVKIVALFIFGLGALLALIDFIRMLIDNYKVDPDAYI